MSKPRIKAYATADAILEDLCGRKGVGDELDQVKYDDEETWEEIRDSLAALIEATLSEYTA